MPVPPIAHPTPRRAVVLLSGGLDSAVCLAIARREGWECHALSFAYGQRHDAELDAARRIAAHLGASSHRVVSIDLAAFGGSALTDRSIPVPHEQPAEPIPLTYVPARNTIFLSYALGVAEALEAGAIYIGVNAVDYSGYPDCRPDYISAFQRMADLATRAGVEGRGTRISAPLLRLAKRDIIRRGLDLGVDFGGTLSCYDPRPDRSGPGLLPRPCAECDACRLRAAAFAELGITDPALGARR